MQYSRIQNIGGGAFEAANPLETSNIGAVHEYLCFKYTAISKIIKKLSYLMRTKSTRVHFLAAFCCTFRSLSLTFVTPTREYSVCLLLRHMTVELFLQLP